ncbi:unnamed protein product [Prunus armeniaca]
MESLKTGKPSRPSTSYELDQKLKKKVVEESENEDDTQANPIKKEVESDRFGPPVKEYTTKFHNQAMVLDIDVNNYDVFMKCIGGLADYIWKELKLFTVDTIEEATMKAIAIEAKNKRTDKKDDRSKPINKTDWQKNGK